MKATLEFDLPEEAELHRDALQGSEWRWAMDALASYLRNETKHGEHSAEEYRIYDAVRERLFQILDDHGLRLY